VVEALVSTMQIGLGNGLIQIGPDLFTSIKEITGKIVQISGKKIAIEYDLSKTEGDKGRCADYGKAKNILNWEPTVSLEEGLAEMYQWISAKLNG
jgi:GDP-D-mannose 3', 5'-epimerase